MVRAGVLVPPAPRLHGGVLQRLNVTSEDIDEHEDLLAIGYRSNLYRDDVAAMAIEREEHLIKWNDDEDQNLWIDRYDIRALVDDARVFTRKKVQGTLSAAEEAEEVMMDEFRYEGLPASESGAERYENMSTLMFKETPSESLHSVPEEGPNSHWPSSHGYSNACHFSFPTPDSSGDGNMEQSAGARVLLTSTSGMFQHKEGHVVPVEIQGFASQLGLANNIALPKSRKQHQAIEKTARFVQKQGEKMEATLKVRHGGNPAFGFLLVDNPLQPYYQAVKRFLALNSDTNQSLCLLPPEAEESVAALRTQCDITEEPTTVGTVEETHSGLVASSGNEEQQGASAGKNCQREGEFNVELVSSLPGQSLMVKRDIPEPPTEEMRTALEKLAQWVAKSGREFEAKVRERQRGDKRFDFLLPWSPYNAFYVQRLEQIEHEIEEGKLRASGEGKANVQETDRPEEVEGNATIERQPGVDAGEDAGKEEEYQDIPVRVAITSFGGEEEGDAVICEEQEYHVIAAGQERSQVSLNKGVDARKIDDTSSTDPKACVESGATSSQLTDEQKKRAARLQRAKALAEKLQESQVPKEKENSRSPARPRETRSRSPSKERSRERMRNSSEKSPPRSRSRARRKNISRRSRSRDRRSRRSGSRSRDRRSRRSGSRSRDRRSRRSGSRSRDRRSRRSRSRSRDRRSRRSRSRSRDRKRQRRHNRSRSRSRSSGERLKRSRSRDFETHNNGEMKISSVNQMSGPEENVGQLSEELRTKVRALLGQL